MSVLHKKYFLIFVSGLCISVWPWHVIAKKEAVSSKKIDKKPTHSHEKKQSAKKESLATITKNTTPIDSIKVAIFAEEGTEIILSSETDRPAFGSGVIKPLNEIVDERLVYLDAKKYKAVPDDDSLDKYIARVLRENNMPLDDLKHMIIVTGRTFEEGREELRKLQAVSSMIGNKVHTGVLISRQMVADYHESHPEQVPTLCFVSHVMIPFDEHDKNTQKKMILDRLATQEGIESFSWSKPFWLAENEVSSDKQFIFNMELDEISSLHETEQGFELFRVHEKKVGHVRSLEERYQEIVDILAGPKYKECLDNYLKTLHNAAVVVYF